MLNEEKQRYNINCVSSYNNSASNTCWNKYNNVNRTKPEF